MFQILCVESLAAHGQGEEQDQWKKRFHVCRPPGKQAVKEQDDPTLEYRDSLPGISETRTTIARTRFPWKMKVCCGLDLRE